MSFHYELLKRVELEAITTPDGRIYQTPVGNLPSVTTVIGRKLKSPLLDKWKKRMGEKRAEQIVAHAAAQGTTVHNLCEHFLKGDCIDFSKVMPTNLCMFKMVSKILVERITTIYGVEYPLYSLNLNTAGRADGIVQWVGRNVILDFKTATKRLSIKDERILKYNLQLTAYAMMVEEMHGLVCPYNVVVVIPKDMDFPQVIIKTNVIYRDMVRELFA